MRNLIIGGCSGYNINQIKPWVLSINEHISECDKVLCVDKLTDQTKHWLVEQGFTLVDIPKNINLPIHVLRFFSIYDYLKDNWRKYDYVVTTDVKDVIFQANPFPYVEKMFWLDYNLIAGSESLKYKDEPWGDDNLKSAYGEYVYNLYKDKTIYNVGTIGGSAELVKDLIFNIFTNAINRPIFIVDQAVYNVLIQTEPFYSQIFFANQSDAWAVQAGTTADPSKIDFFRPNLLEAEPIFEDGLVKTGQNGRDCKKGTPFIIVHQYDRVPEWKRHIYAKYGVEQEVVYFKYNTN